MPLADPTSEYTAAQARRRRQPRRGGGSSLVHCCAGHHRGAAAGAAAAAFRSQHDEDGRHTQKRTKLRLLCSSIQKLPPPATAAQARQ